jgi:hypothetical protein
MNDRHPPPYSRHAGSGDANTLAWNEASDSNDDRAAAGTKHDVDGGVYLCLKTIAPADLPCLSASWALAASDNA